MLHGWHQFSKNVQFASFKQVLLGMFGLYMLLSNFIGRWCTALKYTTLEGNCKRQVGSLFGEGMFHNRKSSAHEQFDHYLFTRTVSGMSYFNPVPNTVWLIFTPIMIFLIVDIYLYQYTDAWHGLLQAWAVATLSYLSNKCPTTVDVPMTRSPFVTSQTAFRANLHHGITDNIYC